MAHLLYVLFTFWPSYRWRPPLARCARGLEAATRAKHATLWRTHCAPEWAVRPMAAVTRLEAQAWVDRLTATRRARHHVQALLGHESFATTQRYAHLAPDAHSRVIESWSRRRDASVTHGPVSRVPG
jgi:hypothetical protein